MFNIIKKIFNMVFGLYDLEPLCRKLHGLSYDLTERNRHGVLFKLDWLYDFITIDDLLPKHEHKFFELEHLNTTITPIGNLIYIEFNCTLFELEKSQHTKDILEKLKRSLTDYKINYRFFDNMLVIAIYFKMEYDGRIT